MDPRIQAQLAKGYRVEGAFRAEQEIRLRVLCPRGHGYEVANWRFAKGVECGACAGKDSEEFFKEIKSEIETEGWKLETTQYKGSTRKLKLRDPEGQLHLIDAISWRKGYRSARGPTPQKRNRTIEEVRADFKKEGYELLEKKFTGVLTKMKALCPQGHTFQVHWNHWKDSQVRCPTCFGTPQWTLEEVQADPLYAAKGYSVEGLEKQGGKVLVVLKCEKGHFKRVQPSVFKVRQYRCTDCHPQASVAELEILREIQELYPDAQKEKIEGVEFDIVTRAGGFALEYCGLRYHSEAILDPDLTFKSCLDGKEYNKLIRHHSYKMQVLAKHAPELKLFTIFEDEWELKKEIVLARVLKRQKIFARDTVFKPIDLGAARDFTRTYHLQGATPLQTTYSFGLFQRSELVGVICFGPHHRPGHDGIQILSRLCFGKYDIVGGSEKLWKNSLKRLPKKPIWSWSDNRYSTGKIYQKLGFKFAQKLRPEYFYCQPGHLFQRKSKQSMRKTKMEKLSKRAEHILRLEQGWFRIYDCGKIRWVYNP
jgi:hypothetical protein